MFGLLVSGRPVQALEPVGGDPNTGRFAASILQPETVNHIVVFLSQPLPDGFGAGVYFNWPAITGGPDAARPADQWTYLGFLSNQKPSAIYKIVKPKAADPSLANPQQATAMALFGGSTIQNMATVGISVENLAGLQSQSQPGSEASSRSTNEEFCTKMLENFVNYAISFAISNPANPSEQYVPLKTVNTWYDTFKRKLAADPNFWK